MFRINEIITLSFNDYIIWLLKVIKQKRHTYFKIVPNIASQIGLFTFNKLANLLVGWTWNLGVRTTKYFWNPLIIPKENLIIWKQLIIHLKSKSLTGDIMQRFNLKGKHAFYLLKGYFSRNWFCAFPNNNKIFFFTLNAIYLELWVIENGLVYFHFGIVSFLFSYNNNLSLS